MQTLVLEYLGHGSAFSFVKRELLRSELHHSISCTSVDAEGLIILVLFLDGVALEKRMVNLRHLCPCSSC